MELKLDYAAIGARIRAFRHKRGMTSERLAELADTSKANISHIETNNTKLSLAMLVRIANALGVTPNELLSDTLSPRKVQFEQQLAPYCSGNHKFLSLPLPKCPLGYVFSRQSWNTRR